MTVINKPDMNYGLWAENGNIEIPSSEKVELGWIAEKPLNEQMNWVQNRQDAMLQYINQHGIVEWDNVTEYPINAFVAREGVVYKALSQNVDKDPTLNTAIWIVAFADFSIVDTITKIRDEDGYVEHYVRKSAPVLNAVAKGVGYAGQDLSKGVFFDSGDNAYVKNGDDTRYMFNGTNTDDNDVVRIGDLPTILEKYTKYRVGDLYITTLGSNPKDILGYGTWQRFAEGRTLVGVSETSSKTPDWTKFINSNYGEYEHQLTKEEMPSHKHDMGADDGGNININYTPYSTANPDERKGVDTNDEGAMIAPTGSSGSNEPHNNVQPSIVVAIWLRVA